MDYRLLELMYNEKRGITTRYGRTYYPIKSRSCKNCHFANYDSHSLLFKGCEFFNKEKSKICIPVRDDSIMSEIHADDIREYIYKYLL